MPQKARLVPSVNRHPHYLTWISILDAVDLGPSSSVRKKADFLEVAWLLGTAIDPVAYLITIRNLEAGCGDALVVGPTRPGFSFSDQHPLV